MRVTDFSEKSVACALCLVWSCMDDYVIRWHC